MRDDFYNAISRQILYVYPRCLMVIIYFCKYHFCGSMNIIKFKNNGVLMLTQLRLSPSVLDQKKKKKHWVVFCDLPVRSCTHSGRSNFSQILHDNI